MTVIGYGRVSTKAQEKDGHSLDQQKRALERMALEKGWNMIWKQDAATGRKDERTGLQEAMKLLECGEASGICVTKLDRIFRSTVHLGQFMQQCKERSWQFVAMDLNIDTTTPMGECILTILSAIAQYEVELIRQRTREGLAEARAKGSQLGPLRGKRLPTRVIEELRRDRENGFSYRKLAQWLRSKGYKTLAGSRRWTEKDVWRQLEETPAERKRAIREYKKQTELRLERQARAKAKSSR